MRRFFASLDQAAAARSVHPPAQQRITLSSPCDIYPYMQQLPQLRPQSALPTQNLRYFAPIEPMQQHLSVRTQTAIQNNTEEQMNIIGHIQEESRRSLGNTNTGSDDLPRKKLTHMACGMQLHVYLDHNKSIWCARVPTALDPSPTVAATPTCMFQRSLYMPFHVQLNDQQGKFIQNAYHIHRIYGGQSHLTLLGSELNTIKDALSAAGFVAIPSSAYLPSMSPRQHLSPPTAQLPEETASGAGVVHDMPILPSMQANEVNPHANDSSQRLTQTAILVCLVITLELKLICSATMRSWTRELGKLLFYSMSIIGSLLI